MNRIEKIMEVAKGVQPTCEPLIASSTSSTINGVLVETLGASVPRRGKGEGVIFTMKVHINKDRVDERLTQEAVDEMTNRIHQDLSARLAQLVGGLK